MSWEPKIEKIYENGVLVSSTIQRTPNGPKEALAQPEQERKLICKMFGTLPIYDTPSQPKETEQKSVTTEREAIAVWLEKECDEQFLADRVRAGDYAKEKGHTENCAALANDIGKRHLSPSLVGVGESNSTSQPETPYEVGRRIAKTGGGMSHLWSAVSHDGELAEAERGFKDAQLKEPEPVARYKEKCADGSRCLHGCLTGEACYYTTPPQRTWVGLTRRERFEIEKAMLKYYDYQHECKTVCLPEFAAAIEAKLKDKNT